MLRTDNWLRRVVALTFAVAILAVSVESSAVDRVDRYFQRPAAHAFLGNIGSSTTSYGERTLFWANPSSCVESWGNCRLEFDYFVDSEENWDYLRVRVDGNIKLSVSGRNRASRASIAVGPGSHLVRFSYEKDGSVDVGRDIAWIDNVETVAPGGIQDSFTFFERSLAAPPGWSVGGYGSGWTVAARPQRRGLGRPSAHSFLGYQMSGTTSWVERSVYFATTGHANVHYFVDSEESYDFFRIKLDGQQQFQLSGLDKRGYYRVNVPTAGWHTLRFEYYKDTSVDAGLDLARVDSIRYFDNTGTMFADQNFDGEDVGTPSSWSCGGYGGCWHVRAIMPPRAYLTSEWPTVTPVVDGNVNPEGSAKEYENPTVLAMPDYGQTQKAVAWLLLQPKASTGELFLGFRAVSATPGLGDEKGTIELYFDANHFNTLTGQGECTGAPELPGTSDRRITVEYTIAPGQSAGTITATTQYIGNCANWAVVSGGSQLPFSVAVGEKSDNLGFVDVEAKVSLQSLPGFFGSSGYLGFGMTHAGEPYAGGTRSAERMPGLDHGGPHIRDVTTWETLRLGSPLSTLEALENWFDGGPKKNKLKKYLQ